VIEETVSYASGNPCTYWFDNDYYNLSNIKYVGNFNYFLTPETNLFQHVAFNFCEKLNIYEETVEHLRCNDLNLYALEYNSLSVTDNCRALSTSSFQSVTQKAFSGYVGTNHYANNLAI